MQGEVPNSPIEVGCESFRGGGKDIGRGSDRIPSALLDSCRCMQLVFLAARGGEGEGGGVLERRRLL